MYTLDTILGDLLAAFYTAPDYDTFLTQAGTLLGAYFQFAEPEELPSQISPADCQPYPATLQNSAYTCFDLVYEHIYIGTLALSATGSQAEEALRATGALMLQGAGVYGWFQSRLGVHPNMYLLDNLPTDGGIYCLYCRAPMSTRAGACCCNTVIDMAAPLHSYREPEGFSILLQSALPPLKLFDSLSAYLHDAGYTAGVAGPFASAELAEGCMEKAKEAAYASASATGSVCFLSQLRWQLFCTRAMQSVQMEGFQPDDFLQHDILRLLHYDKENDTQYFESMYAYLLHGKSLKTAAEQLGIHRNTLDYRIGRISELFDIDFRDRHICYELLFSCKLYKEVAQH